MGAPVLQATKDAIPGGAAEMGGESRGLILLLTFVPQCAVSMVSLSPPVMAGQITHSLGLPPQVTGLYVGLIYAGAMLSNSYAATLITRWGPLRTSCACVVGAGAGLALLAIPNLAASLLAIAILGLSYGPLTPASSQALARYRRGPGIAFLVSVRQTSVPMGGVLAGLVAPPLVLAWGWSAACGCIGAVTAALGAAMWSGVPLVRQERPGQGHGHGAGLLEPVRFILRRPGLSALASSSVIYAAMQLVLSSFLVVYLTSATGLDLLRAGALLSASQLAGVGGRLGWGLLADRVASPRLLLLGLACLMATGCGLMSLFSSEWPFWALAAVAILLGATASGWNGVFLAEIIRDVRPAEVGLATAGSMVFAYLGTVFGPSLFGGIGSALGFRPAFLLLAAAGLMAGVIGTRGGGRRGGDQRPIR